MAIPWLIGAGVFGVCKAIYDSYEEDERRERAQRNARVERREREAEVNKQREEVIEKEKVRAQSEQKELLKIYTESQAKIILDKYNITSLTPENLAATAISNPIQASADMSKHFTESRSHNDLVKKVTSLEKSIDERAELQKILKGL